MAVVAVFKEEFASVPGYFDVLPVRHTFVSVIMRMSGFSASR